MSGVSGGSLADSANSLAPLNRVPETGFSA
jgi:hypothetical protein